MSILIPKFVGKYQNVVFDWEANDLLDEVTEAWCMTAWDLDTDEYHTFSMLTGNRESWHEDAIDLLSNAKLHSSHFGYGYDYRLMKKMFGVDFHIRPDIFNGNSDLVIYDTYLLSQMVDPDREECRAIQINMSTGEKKKIGKHSVASYGVQFGLHKKEILRWDVFDARIIERCEWDVGIQSMAHRYLIKRLNAMARVKGRPL